MRSSKTASGGGGEVVVGRRLFSRQEANRALALVRRIARDVVSGYQGVLDCQEILEILQTRGTREQIERLQHDLLRMVERLQGYSDELLDIGVELKDWAEGHVDFPARVDGRRVMLCWRYGEESVDHWHGLDAACDARQPLSPEPVSAAGHRP